MILYFSSTGNSKHVATKISNACHEKILSIEECLKNNTYRFDLEEGELFGIVAPVYFYGLPKIVYSYLDALEIPNSVYYFCCFTYGTNIGLAAKQVEEIFQSKGAKLHGKFGIKTVDSWSPYFNLNNHEKNKEILSHSELILDKVIFKIKMKTHGKYGITYFPKFLGKTMYKRYESARKTKNFKVMDYCILCKKCINECPEHAISIENNKIVWIKEKCTLCLRCLHHCPKFAIQYGHKTNKHGQYDYSLYSKDKKSEN